MGQRMKNAIAVFSDTKARGIIILLFAIAVIAFLITFISIRHARVAGPVTQAQLTGAPSNIRAIPGVGEPTREYVKLQEQQNVQQAEEALKAKTAAIPTLTRTTYLDSGALLEGATKGGCSVEELQRARAAGVTVEELRCRGCSLAALKAAGFTAGELMKAGFSTKELRDAGFIADDLKNAGFSALDLKAAGFSATDLKNAGFIPSELKSVGFNAADLKTAGFTPQDLVAGGFNANELQSIGIAAKDLLNAGITPTQLKNAGFSDKDLKDAGLNDAAVASAKAASQQCSVENLRALRAKGISGSALKDMGCSVAALRAAGFTAQELKAAGFSAKDLKDGGFSAQDLKDAGFIADDLKAAGSSAGELRQVGFTADDLKGAGFTAKDLKGAGFSGSELKNVGFSPEEMRTAGFSEGDLVRAGFATLASKTAASEAAATKPAAPTSVVTTAVVSTASPLPVSAPVAKSQKPKVSWLTSFEEQRKQNATKLSDQEFGDRMKQMQQGMATQAGELFASWVPLPTQQYNAAEEEKGGGASGGVGGEAGGGPAGLQSGGQIAAQIAANSDIYKAGTILFATLDTGINSDEQSPILATIVHGKLRGSKVLGNFQRLDQKVLLQFSVISVPYLTNSLSFNAVAIDQNTARTAISTNVDNHYMVRYGSLFAASFVSGLGQAIQTSGSSTQTSLNGQQQNFFPKLDAGGKALVALGGVGQQFGNVLNSIFNKPPTVTVAAGSGIGVLLMADLPIPRS